MSAEPRQRSRRRCPAVVVFALVQLSMLCWVLATPLLSGPDEGAHLVKAAALVRGQLLGEPGTQTVLREVRVPEAYAGLGVFPPCYAGDPNRPADCLQSWPADAGPEVEAATYVVRYPPLFYVVAGWPTLFLAPESAARAVRLLTSIPAALLVTAALMTARARRGALLGVLVGTPPMLLYLASVTNPNGLEIAAALCLWSTGVALADVEPGEPPPARWVTTAFGLSGLVLALVRGSSFAWLFLIWGALLALSFRRGISLVRQDPRLRRWIVVDALAAVVGIGYVVVARSLEVLKPPEGVDATGIRALRLTAGRVGTWASGAVADFGWLDSPAPTLTYAVWAVALLGLGVAAWRAGSRRVFLVVAGLVVLSVGGSILLEAARLPEFGYGWQGRYLLPVLVGIPVLLGWKARQLEQHAWLLPSLAGALVVAHAAAFWWCVRRFTVGLDGSLLARGAAWSPPLPPLLLLLVYGAALAGLVLAVLRSPRRHPVDA